MLELGYCSYYKEENYKIVEYLVDLKCIFWMEKGLCYR